MKDFAGTVTETLKHIGISFLMSYYFPSMAFVILHVYILVPVWGGQKDLWQFWTSTTALVWPNLGNVDAVGFLSLLLLPVIIGVMLAAANDTLIRVLEGEVWWLKHFLFHPVLQRQRRKCTKLYGQLTALRREYRRVDNLRMKTTDNDRQIAKQLAGLAYQIDQEHRRLEKVQPCRVLPYELHRVAPTRFGNSYSMAEEYVYNHYGIDAVLFWPYLRSLMHETTPSHSQRITHQKSFLDLSLNLACLSALIAVEAALTVLLGDGSHRELLFVVCLTALGLLIAFRSSSLSSVIALGQLIVISFDLHRSLILKGFGLTQPEPPEDEQVLWVKLAAFIRRGDAFYNPKSATDPDSEPGGRVGNPLPSISTSGHAGDERNNH